MFMSDVQRICFRDKVGNKTLLLQKLELDLELELDLKLESQNQAWLGLTRSLKMQSLRRLKLENLRLVALLLYLLI